LASRSSASSLFFNSRASSSFETLFSAIFCYDNSIPRGCQVVLEAL
jgi:hypothetical protein